MRPTSWFLPVVLVVGAIGACASDPQPIVAVPLPLRAEVAAPPEIAPVEHVAHADGDAPLARPFLRYSCEGVTIAARKPGHPVVGAMLRALPLDTPDAPASGEAAERALSAAESVPLPELSSRDRVLVQAAAARAAREGSPHAGRAIAVVRRMALEAHELEALGSDPRPELEPILGPAEGWIERRGPSCGPAGLHDRAFGGGLAFRTLRAGDRRALVAQAVAFDVALDPHVTPFVALVEMRTAPGVDADACVLDATDAGLRTVPFAELVPSTFVQPGPKSSVACGRCHSGAGIGDLADLDREAGGAFRIERRLTLLEIARRRGRELHALAQR